MNNTSIAVAGLVFACLPAMAFPEDAMPAEAAPAAQVTPVAASTEATTTGTVVFFREWKFAGGGVRYKVREGSVELCKLANGTYCVVTVPVGKHAYTVHSEAADVLTLEVESGDTYYLKGDLSVGFLAGHPHLLPSDQATYESLKPKLKDNTGVDLAPGKN